MLKLLQSCSQQIFRVFLPLIISIMAFTSCAIPKISIKSRNKQEKKLKLEATRNSLRWNHSPLEIEKNCLQARSRFMAITKKIEKNSPKSFRNLVTPIEFANAELINSVLSLSFYASSSTDEKKRNAGMKCKTELLKLDLDFFTNKKIYGLFAQLRQSNEYRRLPSIQQRLVRDYLKQFQDKGLHLPQDRQELIKVLSTQIINLRKKYNENITNWNKFFLLTKKELDGLPLSTLNNLAKEKGKYKVTLKYPHFFPIMEYVRNPETRKKIYKAFEQRGGLNNKEIFYKIIHLRSHLASVLGLNNHAERKMKGRMAKTPQKAMAFLKSLEYKLIKRQREELIEIKAEKNKASYLSIAERKELHPWDIMYFERIMKEKKFGINPEEIRKYFPLKHVITQMFKTYEEMLGVQFKENKNKNRWHHHVRFFDIIESKNKKTIGGFYIDLFPRDGKYTHAAAFPIIKTYTNKKGDRVEPVSTIIANFSSPTQDHDSLLTHNEVITFFHEFGHIMHGTLSNASYPSQSGTAVLRDFVEMPSQVMEFWVWDEETLTKISSHYKTKNPMPRYLIKKLIASRHFNKARYYMNQLFYASIDLKYHMINYNDNQLIHDTSKLYHDLFEQLQGMKPLRDTYPEASFGHIVNGYDAGYYGYLWSKVFATDLFSKFKEKGLTDKKTGASYRANILEPGDSRPPKKLMKSFLGREANEKAFLKELDQKS